MKTNRYNIYNLIHKALRALMYDTALTIQHTDFADAEQAQIALTKINSVVTIFKSHSFHEDSHVMPAVRKFDLYSANEVESEHERDEVLMQQLESKIAEIKNAASSEIAKSAGVEMHYLFIDFMAFNLTHMNMEEEIINQILWKHYDDEELKAITGKIVSSQTPSEAMFSLEWMIRGISNSELEALLAVLNSTMPAPAYVKVLQLAEQVLPAKRWNKISLSKLEAA